MKTPILRALVPAIGLVTLVSCGSKSGSGTVVSPDVPVAPNPTVTPAAKGADILMAPAEGQWKHANALVSHLEFGGHSFSYSSNEQLNEMVVDLLGFAEKVVAKAAPEGKAIRLVKPYEELGLSKILGSGHSLRKSGKLWHHQGIFYIPEGRTGLMAMAGGEAKPWLAGQLAPKGTDLVVEFNLDVLAGYEMVERILVAMGGDIKEQSDQLLTQAPLPESPRKICEMLSGRQVYFLEVDKKRQMVVPGAPGEFPGVDFAIAMESKALVEYLIGKLGEVDAEMFDIQKQPDGIIRVASKEALVPTDETSKPAGFMDPARGLVVVASSAAYLARIEAKEAKLPEGRDFQSAAQGLPGEGNALFYVSGKLQDEVASTIVKVARDPAMGSNPEMVQELENFLVDLAIPDASGQMLVVAAHKDGLVWGANVAIADIGVVAPAMAISTLSAIGFAAFDQARETASITSAMVKGKQIATALLVFSVDHEDRLPKSLGELVDGNFLDDASVLEIRGDGDGLKPEWQLLFPGAKLRDLPGDAPILGSSLPLEDGHVVALADGSVMTMTPEAFQAAVNKARAAVGAKDAAPGEQ